MTISKSTTITVQGVPLTLGVLRQVVLAAEGLPDDLVVLGSTTSRTIYRADSLSELTVATDPERRTCVESGCREPATRCGTGWDVYCDEHAPAGPSVADANAAEDEDF